MGNSPSTASPASLASPAAPAAAVVVSPKLLENLTALRGIDARVASRRVCVPRTPTPACLEKGAELLTALHALAASVATARARVEGAVADARRTVKELQRSYSDYVTLVRALRTGRIKNEEVTAACADGASALQSALTTCADAVDALHRRLAARSESVGLKGGGEPLCITDDSGSGGGSGGESDGGTADGMCYAALALPSLEVARMLLQLQADVDAHAEATLWLVRAEGAAKKQRELIDKQVAALMDLTRAPTCAPDTVHAVSALLEPLAACRATETKLAAELAAAQEVSAAVVAVTPPPTEAKAKEVAAAAHAVAAATVATATDATPPTVPAAVAAEDAVAAVVTDAGPAAATHAAGSLERIVTDVVLMRAADVKAAVESGLVADDAALDAPVRNPLYLRGFLLAFFQASEGGGAAAQKRYDALVAAVKAPPPPKPATPVERVGAYVPAAPAPPVESALMFEPARRRLILRRLLATDPLLHDTLRVYLSELARRSRGVRALAGGMALEAPVVTLQEWDDGNDGALAGLEGLAGGLVPGLVHSVGRGSVRGVGHESVVRVRIDARGRMFKTTTGRPRPR